MNCLSVFDGISVGYESLKRANLPINNHYASEIERINEICEAAFDNQVPLFIDAEETWIQATIDRIVQEMMRKYNREKAIIYNTVQL